MADLSKVQKYGDLTDDALLKFIATLEQDDDSLEDSIKAIRGSDKELDLDDLEVPDIDPLAEPKDQSDRPILARSDYWNFTPEQHSEQAIRLAAERRALKMSIQRKAFDQAELPMTAQIPKCEIKMLITKMTEKERDTLIAIEAAINKQVTTLLKPLIPSGLRWNYLKYPQSIIRCPGFMYKTEPVFGETRSFYVTPNLPYYFEQGTEKAHILEAGTWAVSLLDNKVFKYHKFLKDLQKKEIRISTNILNKGIYTYFDLLKHNVKWFAALYEAKTGKVLQLID